MKEEKTSVFKSFPRSFWVANVMELFERFAYFGMYLVLAIYLTGSTNTGALGFSQVEKGLLFSISGTIMYFLPIFSGAIADKYGYKKTLVVAYIFLFTGYLMIGSFTSFGGIFFAFLWMAIGASLFKPIISATVSKATNAKNASLGFGIFYQMVNIGSFIGPIIASTIRGFDWFYVFIMAAMGIAINMILLIFYIEPEREINEEPLKKTLITIWKNIITVLSDKKLLFFILIIIGFWTMYWQMFMSLPNFIEQWSDTPYLIQKIDSIWPWLADRLANDDGTINVELLINLDALLIIFFQILISYLVKNIFPINSIMYGIVLSSIGIGLTIISMNPIFIVVGITIFAVGEMASSARVYEYIGRIAPKDKVALYMGCAYLPVAGGSLFGGLISGNVYQAMSDKISLLKQHLSSKGIEYKEITDSYTQDDFMLDAQDKLDMSSQQITQMLWETYYPYNIWWIITGIGLLSALLLFVYKKTMISKSEQQAYAES